MKLRHKKDHLVEQESQRQDFGFGTKLTNSQTRLMQKDGTFNVKRVNRPFAAWLNLYPRLIMASWTKFIWLVFAIFLISNFAFALLYYWIGVDHLQGIDTTTSRWTQFGEAFFFSAQTLTTVGYGRIAPIGFWASFVAAVESLIGLLAFALATGLLYGRFSRPKSTIRFSHNALVSPYLDTMGLMFRIVNERDTRLSEVSVNMMMSRLEQNDDGKKTRRYYTLNLERNHVMFFPISWTVVHPITEESPFYGLKYEDLIENDTELMIQLKGVEDTFYQMVYAQCSYHAREVVWGARFKPMVDLSQSVENIELDLSVLSLYETISDENA
jgi:inward rectifier potassium channel